MQLDKSIFMQVLLHVKNKLGFWHFAFGFKLQVKAYYNTTSAVVSWLKSVLYNYQALADIKQFTSRSNLFLVFGRGTLPPQSAICNEYESLQFLLLCPAVPQ